jgi:hypothetical protein
MQQYVEYLQENSSGVNDQLTEDHIDSVFSPTNNAA